MDLKKEMDKRGLRQDWVAAKVGIDKSYLCRILNGGRKLSKNKELRKRIYDAIINPVLN